MQQEYNRLVKRLAKCFMRPEADIRAYLQRTCMPGSTPLRTAKELLHRLQHSTPRQLTNICRKNGKTLDEPYDQTLEMVRQIVREAKFPGRKPKTCQDQSAQAPAFYRQPPNKEHDHE